MPLSVENEMNATKTLLPLMHLMVDALCACCLCLLSVRYGGAYNILELYILYNVAAFLTQPFTGYVADRCSMERYAPSFCIMLTLVVTVNNVTYSSVEYSITQKLQSLVVQRLALVVALADALVHQRHLVILDVVRIESQYLVKRRKKLLLLAERELDSINDVIKLHTS